MHELAITSALIDVIREEVERDGGGRVVGVALSLGGLQSLEPHSLALCFETMVEGTFMEGAVLTVERLPIRVHCRACGRDVISDERFRCGSCDGRDVVVLPTEPMRVESITVRR